MNPGDIERITVTSFGYWKAEVVHAMIEPDAPLVMGKASTGIWQQLTAAGFGGFDRIVRMRIRFAADPEITTYPTGEDATAHRGQHMDEPELVAAVMRWYVDTVLPRRTPGMRTNWTKDVTPRG